MMLSQWCAAAVSSSLPASRLRRAWPSPSGSITGRATHLPRALCSFPVAPSGSPEGALAWRAAPRKRCHSIMRIPFTCFAQEPYLIAKLDSAEKAWKEMSVKLADPDIVSDPSEYQKLAQSVAELDQVVTTYRQFKDCERILEETKALEKENEGDPDMAEMIASELEALSNQLAELEGKLKLLLIPSDPLDSRNILLEVRAGAGGDEAGIWAGDLVGAHVSEIL